MGRSVYADEATEKYIQELIQGRSWFIGLIIGQLSAQKAYVLRLARTPEVSEDDVVEELESGSESTDQLPSRAKRKAKTRPKSLAQADEQWLSVHAKQVTRMLPGGLDVMGIFAVAPSDMLKESQAKLRQLLLAASKAACKSVAPEPTEAVTDRILLQVDSNTSKIICSSLDVSNTKSALHPAEWRYSSATRWLRLDSTVAVDVSFPVPRQKTGQTMLKDIQTAVSPFCASVWGSVALLDGRVREGSEPLVPAAEGKKGKGKAVPAAPAKESYRVDFLLPLTGDTEEPVIEEVDKMVSVRGILVCRAFVQSRATVGEAIHAIKTDVVRSLCARCELLSEDVELTDEELDMENRQLFDTPVRVFVDASSSSSSSSPSSSTSSSSSGNAQVCDYMFSDEQLEEVAARMAELLDLTVDPKALEINNEQPARKDSWVTASHSEHSLTQAGGDAVKTSQPVSKMAIVCSVAVSGLVAATAAAFSFFTDDS